MTDTMYCTCSCSCSKCGHSCPDKLEAEIRDLRRSEAKIRDLERLQAKMEKILEESSISEDPEWTPARILLLLNLVFGALVLDLLPYLTTINTSPPKWLMWISPTPGPAKVYFVQHVPALRKFFCSGSILSIVAFTQVCNALNALLLQITFHVLWIFKRLRAPRMARCYGVTPAPFDDDDPNAPSHNWIWRNFFYYATRAWWWCPTVLLIRTYLVRSFDCKS
jgi:hypothetical protein